MIKVSPVRKFISEKDKLIGEIGQELTEKSQEIAEISAINNSLKQKLQEYQTQNEENVRLFREESMNSTIKFK